MAFVPPPPWVPLTQSIVAFVIAGLFIFGAGKMRAGKRFSALDWMRATFVGIALLAFLFGAFCLAHFFEPSMIQPVAYPPSPFWVPFSKATIAFAVAVVLAFASVRIVPDSNDQHTSGGFNWIKVSLIAVAVLSFLMGMLSMARFLQLKNQSKTTPAARSSARED